MFLLKRNPFSILLRGLSQSQHVSGERHQNITDRTVDLLVVRQEHQPLPLRVAPPFNFTSGCYSIKEPLTNCGFKGEQITGF